MALVNYPALLALTRSWRVGLVYELGLEPFWVGGEHHSIYLSGGGEWPVDVCGEILVAEVVLENELAWYTSTSVGTDEYLV